MNNLYLIPSWVGIPVTMAMFVVMYIFAITVFYGMYFYSDLEKDEKRAFLKRAVKLGSTAMLLLILHAFIPTVR